MMATVRRRQRGSVGKEGEVTHVVYHRLIQRSMSGSHAIIEYTLKKTNAIKTK